MAKTEILSKIGVGSGLDTSALIEALVLRKMQKIKFLHFQY